MSTKRTFALLLAILGEALLIFSFLHFGKNANQEILILNITVSTVVYCLVFADILLPWINLKDKAQKQIGSIGLRWFFTLFYIVISICLMFFFNSAKPVELTNQILAHGILLFLLMLGLYSAFSASDKVNEIYMEEKQNRNGIIEMKKAMEGLQSKLDNFNHIPSEVISRINVLQENLRFLSPCNNDDAIKLEIKFLDDINELSNSISQHSIDMEMILSQIKNCERTYNQRKQVYSN